MNFATPLIEGRLIRRYKRFLADVRLADDGDVVTVHCPNTGSMLGCAEADSRVWLSRAANPSRKYPYTWELVEVHGGIAVGVNPGRANTIVREAIEAGCIPELRGYRKIRREVGYGREGSRVDLLLEGADRKPDCFLEVKSVTAADGGVAFFPDAVSKRGVKHLRELMAMVRSGYRAVIFFCVQRSDVGLFRPADEIDPEYGATLRQALQGGVEALAWRTRTDSAGIALEACLRVAV